MENIENQNLNLLKRRRMMLEFQYLDMEQEEVSLLSEQYVEKFLNDLIPDGLNPFDDQKENSEEQEEDILDEEKELSDISSDILNRLYRKITYKTHPDRSDDAEFNALFLEANKAYKAKNLPKILLLCEKLNIPIPHLDDTDIKLMKTNCKLIRAKINRVKQQVSWRWCTSETEQQQNEIRKWVRDILAEHVLTKINYDSGDVDEKCSICLEIFRDSMVLAKIRCNHLFHLDCINKWFDVNFTCPLCKQI
tara:strand:+ start:9 stop:758 length:750 start_codon:yes stop_codon:yes gene_type:complete